MEFTKLCMYMYVLTMHNTIVSITTTIHYLYMYNTYQHEGWVAARSVGVEV